MRASTVTVPILVSSGNRQPSIDRCYLLKGVSSNSSPHSIYFPFSQCVGSRQYVRMDRCPPGGTNRRYIEDTVPFIIISRWCAGYESSGESQRMICVPISIQNPRSTRSERCRYTYSTHLPSRHLWRRLRILLDTLFPIHKFTDYFCRLPLAQTLQFKHWDRQQQQHAHQEEQQRKWQHEIISGTILSRRVARSTLGMCSRWLRRWRRRESIFNDYWWTTATNSLFNFSSSL